MPLIVPSRMVYDRIETHAVYWNAVRNCREYFVAQISQPCRPRIIFNTSFRNKEWFAIMLESLLKQIAHMSVSRIGRHDYRAAFARIRPLIMDVVVDSNDIDQVFLPAEFWRLAAGDHVVGFVLTAMIW